ncbi:unnamed protein product [Cuscuta europaea]|uniref:CCHC-type domain-containing protein n=1 Tax=Cuscuta europaea TaxID=41803 RepID=A0A9P0ZWL1_CUSEU|nr:unnamed protein product [Cuscuta europaea]
MEFQQSPSNGGSNGTLEAIHEQCEIMQLANEYGQMKMEEEDEFLLVEATAPDTTDVGFSLVWPITSEKSAFEKVFFLQTDEGVNLCVDFCYEELPSSCFACGIIGHPGRYCPRYPEGGGKSGGLPLGPRLRASKGRAHVGGNK